MEPSIAFYYGYFFIILGSLLALYSQLKGISTPLSELKNGIHPIKWSQFAWFSFFSLTFIGTIILFLSPFNIINYRIIWAPIGDSYKLSFGITSNFYTITVDCFLIIFCFVRLFVGIKKVGMGSQAPFAGRFTFKPAKVWELIALITGHPYFLPIFLIFLFIIGVSFLLIAMYTLVITPLFYLIIKEGIPY